MKIESKLVVASNPIDFENEVKKLNKDNFRTINFQAVAVPGDVPKLYAFMEREIPKAESGPITSHRNRIPVEPF